MAPPISEPAPPSGLVGDSTASAATSVRAATGAHPRLAASGFTRPVLCAVLDAAGLGNDPRATALAYFEAGVDWIQLRDRTLSDLECLRCARALVAARETVREAHLEASRRAVLVNKRTDLAGAAGADGAHLGFDSLPLDEVTRAAPALWDVGGNRLGVGDVVFGRARHSVAEVSEAAEGASGAGQLHYVHLAPIWDPKSKPASRAALGEEALRKAAAVAGEGLAVIAQGGLDPERAVRAVSAGAAGIAVTGVLSQGEDALQAIRVLRAALDRCTEAAHP